MSTDGDAMDEGWSMYEEQEFRAAQHEEAHALRHSGPVCIYCEGSGKRRGIWVPKLRRLATVDCWNCDGTGHRVAS